LAPGHPLVHLELQTANLARACAFYQQLLGWEVELVVHASGRYHALAIDGGIGGGVVEDERVGDASWVPYVEVADVVEATAQAEGLGASVLLDPREGPAGWRSLVGSASAGPVALWRPKRFVASPLPWIKQ
jgi:uncharacterized protein